MTRVSGSTGLAPTRERIDGRTYSLQVRRRIEQPADAPRLIIAACQPNRQAREILEVCIRAVRRHTPEAHELWVVDNNSPDEQTDWLCDQDGINLVLNRTSPLAPGCRGFGPFRKKRAPRQGSASYANAAALEIALRLIAPETRYVMTLHMDTMPCCRGWLSFLRSKIRNGVAAAGVRMDTARTPEGVLHVLGLMVDYRLFRQLGLDFFPRLPRYDVGDRVTVALREAGHGVYACRNTLHDKALAGAMPAESPFRDFDVDRAVDDDGRVIFLHLGRGTSKALGTHVKKIMPDQWVGFARDHVLQ